jgi:hypothetical protein
MPVTIKVNGTNLSLVHKFSNGISTATVPDVCKTPTPGGPVPMPYPNIAQSITLSNGTTTVKGDKAMAANKGSKFALSNGDQPGTIGGIKSNVFMKEATWILYAPTVKMDGKNACRFTDPMFHNSENTVNLSGVINPIVIQRFEDIIKDCVTKAEEDWDKKNNVSDYKTYCASKRNRTRRGKQIEKLAFACISEKMEAEDGGRSNEIKLDQPYNNKGPGGALQAVAKTAKAMKGTLRPDIVLHMPGVDNAVRAVYDIKAPCPPGSNVPGWGGTKLLPGRQGVDYMLLFRVVPKMVSPGNIIVTGATLSSTPALAAAAEKFIEMATALKLSPW